MGVETASILVVDDDPDQRSLLAALFARAGHVVRCAASASAALAALADDPLPDLILLDLGMPKVGGLALLTQLRDAERTAGVPVIIVSGESDVAKRSETLEAGANDYLAKPVNAPELLVRARNVLCNARELDRLRRGTFLDPLTGLLNRLGLDHLLGLQAELAIRHHHPLAVMFLDLDGFKCVNDVCGHAVGDRVLRDVARALEYQLRGSDFAARWGGDEFVVVLPGASPDTLARVVTRLETSVAAVQTGRGTRLGVSIGVARLFEDVPIGDDTAGRLVTCADEAMYVVKQAHHAILDVEPAMPHSRAC